MKNHSDLYVVITGASSGIGASFARIFAKEGYSLILVARRTERLEELKKELQKNTNNSQEILLFTADLSKEQEIYNLFQKIEEKKILYFINNAGFGDCGCFPETDIKKDLAMIDVNIRALHLCLKLALKKMQKNNKGYILNVGSSAGLLPAGPYMATYYASKAYVVSLTRGVNYELKERKSNIYVGALCPGPVDTEFNKVASVEFALPGISANACAEYAVKMMRKKKMIIVPAFRMKMVVFVSRLLPTRFMTKVTAHQQKKKISQ